MLTVVRGIAPRDEMEALIAAQMAAIHNAVMAMARCFNHVETIPQQDGASNAQQALAHVCSPGRGVEAIPVGWRADDQMFSMSPSTRGAGDRWQYQA
jgi:hypothetical protein